MFWSRWICCRLLQPVSCWTTSSKIQTSLIHSVAVLRSFESLASEATKISRGLININILHTSVSSPAAFLKMKKERAVAARSGWRLNINMVNYILPLLDIKGSLWRRKSHTSSSGPFPYIFSDRGHADSVCRPFAWPSAWEWLILLSLSHWQLCS